MKCMWKKMKSSKQQSLHLLLIKWISGKTYQDRWPFPLHRPDNRHRGGRSHVWRTCGWCCFPVRSWWRNRTDTPQCQAPHPPTPHHLHPQNLQLKGHKYSGRVHLHWQVLSNNIGNIELTNIIKEFKIYYIISSLKTLSFKALLQKQICY